jgi:hypothetical protein
MIATKIYMPIEGREVISGIRIVRKRGIVRQSTSHDVFHCATEGKIGKPDADDGSDDLNMNTYGRLTAREKERRFKGGSE